MAAASRESRELSCRGFVRADSLDIVRRESEAHGRHSALVTPKGYHNPAEGQREERDLTAVYIAPPFGVSLIGTPPEAMARGRTSEWLAPGGGAAINTQHIPKFRTRSTIAARSLHKRGLCERDRRFSLSHPDPTYHLLQVGHGLRKRRDAHRNRTRGRWTGRKATGYGATF